MMAAAALALAACSSPTEDPAATTDAPSGAAAGTDLRVAIFEPVGILDPQAYTGNHVVLGMIYEPLVRYGADGTIVPALATSWEISTDGLTYTFQLRQDVTFHDGTPFNAEAVKWNLDRWVGVEDHTWLGATNAVESVEVLSNNEVEIRVSAPYYPLLQELSLTRPVRMLSPEAVGADGAFSAPIGTGPWMFEASEGESETSLVRNDQYWGDVPALAGVDRVVLRVIPDSQGRLAALLAGEIDVIGGEYLAPIAPEEVTQLQGSEAAEVLIETGTTNLLLTFNNTVPGLDDVAVRRAMNQAIDRMSIAETLFPGVAQPPTNMFPDVIPYVSGDFAWSYDPEAAIAGLEAAGWALDGDVRAREGIRLSFELMLDPAAFPQARALSEAIKDQLSAVGIELVLRLVDSAGYSSAVVERQFQMTYFITFGAPYDPSSSLAGLFDSRTAVDDGKVFTSPELDGLLTATLAATDEASRQEAYDDVWSYLYENAAAAPLLQQFRVWAVSSNVNGFELGSTEYDLNLGGVSRP